MTLGRLLLAWLPVAVWFGTVAWGVHRVIGIAASPAPTRGSLLAVAVEALLVTLFGSLWFDSLGHGEWWVLFGLVGILAAGVPGRPAFVAVAVSVARYVGAGALLAWRLG
jgi:hypothetical protein